MENKKIRKIKLSTPFAPEMERKEYPGKVYCYECGMELPYSCHVRKRERTFREKKFIYNEEFAICNICGQEVTVPGMIEANENEFARISRHQYNLVTMEEICGIMKKYHIGKRPLSKVLGLGEITITRYLEGQIPSEKNSQILQSVYSDYTIMERFLEQNKNEISKKSYEKSKIAIDELKRKMVCNSKIEAVAAYVIHSKYEVTNMSLQKLLYYIKAFGMLMLQDTMFPDSCEAWVHGPVFEVIYNKYKDFGKEIITEEKDENLDFGFLLEEKEKIVIDYVLKYFAVYNGTVLREFTHKEQPWNEAREGLWENERSKKLITDEMIFSYFRQMEHIYHLTSDSGVRNYIASLQVL